VRSRASSPESAEAPGGRSSAPDGAAAGEAALIQWCAPWGGGSSIVPEQLRRFREGLASALLAAQRRSATPQNQRRDVAVSFGGCGSASVRGLAEDPFFSAFDYLAFCGPPAATAGGDSGVANTGRVRESVLCS